MLKFRVPEGPSPNSNQPCKTRGPVAISLCPASAPGRCSLSNPRHCCCSRCQSRCRGARRLRSDSPAGPALAPGPGASGRAVPAPGTAPGPASGVAGIGGCVKTGEESGNRRDASFLSDGSAVVRRSWVLISMTGRLSRALCFPSTLTKTAKQDIGELVLNKVPSGHDRNTHHAEGDCHSLERRLREPRIPTMLGFSAHKDLHTVAHGQTGIVISNEQVNPWLRPLTKFPRRGNGRGRVPM